MPLSTFQIAEFLKANPENGQIAAMLVQSISPRERQVYYLVANNPEITTHDLAELLKTSIPASGNILLRLMRYGLIEREPSRDEHGLYYKWSAIFDE